MMSTAAFRAAPGHGIASECRALIVDDHQLFRNGLSELLSTQPGVTVCGEAGEFHEALEKFQALKPNFVMVDISLAKGNGLDLVERLKTLDPNVSVLVVSMFDEAVYADRAIAAGASGYLCKQAPNEEVLRAVQTVRNNGMYLSQPMMERLLRRKSGSKALVADSEEKQLSTRELQIFSLIGQGETTQRIAQHLNLSPSTVETYRERIKNKLDLANGAELTRRAILWMMRAT